MQAPDNLTPPTAPRKRKSKKKLQFLYQQGVISEAAAATGEIDSSDVTWKTMLEPLAATTLKTALKELAEDHAADGEVSRILQVRFVGVANTPAPKLRLKPMP